MNFWELLLDYFLRMRVFGKAMPFNIAAHSYVFSLFSAAHILSFIHCINNQDGYITMVNTFVTMVNPSVTMVNAL